MLLVTTPSSAFGGIRGGDTSQNRREEQELAAYEDKKVKDKTEQRQRRLNRRISTSSLDSSGMDPMLRMNVSLEELENKRSPINNESTIGQSLPFGGVENTLLSDNPMMLSVLAGAHGSPDSLYRHGVLANLPGDMNREMQVGNVDAAQRPLSPSLMMINGSHHHSPDTGLSSTGQGVQMEIVIAPTATLGGNNPSAPIADFEGRSSASNSDIDSESDDVSFDDSASDRSVGSDSGSDSGSGYFSEPFIAARVMALNRMQQQHRREQYLQDRALRQLAASSTNFQPPPDSEYQSGDSIDSTMADDSCGSDSSSTSDFAD